MKPGHSSHDESVCFSRVKCLKKLVSFHGFAGWHSLVCRREIPGNTSVRVNGSAKVCQAFHPTVLDGVGVEQLELEFVRIKAFPFRNGQRAEVVLGRGVGGRDGYVRLVTWDQFYKQVVRTARPIS